MTINVDTFELGNVDPDAFDHAAHVELAWRYQKRFGIPDGNARFEDALKRFVARLGKAQKFHATTTGFFLDEIARRRRDRQETWPQFKRRNSRLLSDPGDILRRHYRTATLASAAARERYLLPDKPECTGSDGTRISSR